ncbi:hypothetical protein EST38_g7580 [Candolleomyces aberdarensis]|uniref:S-adenosyl-L-methionine-dependent methyltransferase n=1 Tax=Candolleomyces aberdarensis TaxID=2316362 RepID=A0A4Q2DI51_9AGAR|nr:hypothetical protein EST38_g7580 [Candolleomyces aberdarensis]
MKLTTAFSILFDLFLALKVATGPTLRSILAEPTLLLRPTALSRLYMANIWEGGFANGTDEGARPVKTDLITPNADGTVLDLGAGHGHSVRYFDRAKVTRYVAVEPNVLMHPFIREAAHSVGYHESDGSMVILTCGAEDSASILSALESQQVDTIISVLTLCTIPHPEKTVHNLVRDVLKSGGQFLFYEHVLSPRDDVAWWQRFWAPVWQVVFDGCRMDRPSHLFLDHLQVEDDGTMSSPWKETQLWGKPEEPEEHLFWHQVGRFVKK